MAWCLKHWPRHCWQTSMIYLSEPIWRQKSLGTFFGMGSLLYFDVVSNERKSSALQWRQTNGKTSQFTCLSIVWTAVFRAALKESSKLRITGPSWRNQPVTGVFPHKGYIMWNAFPCHGVIIDRKNLKVIWNLHWSTITHAIDVGENEASVKAFVVQGFI